MKPDLSLLSEVFGYQFKDRQLLEASLTHRSLSGTHNERLEFLGDSVLNFVIAEAIYKLYPQAKEGELSRLRANLVQGETLAEIAKEINLGKFLRLGPGEQKSGGAKRLSILADTLEAMVAAIYLDGGMDAAHAAVMRLFEKRLKQKDQLTELKDPKTELQEYLQARKLPVPTYEVTKIEGTDHNQIFNVVCLVAGVELSYQGSGTSRRRAEQQAAAQFLAFLKNKTNQASCAKK